MADKQERREMFAAAALSGLIARGEMPVDGLELAREAFDIADALVAWGDTVRGSRKEVVIPEHMKKDASDGHGVQVF